jgi:hypothetical protein
MQIRCSRAKELCLLVQIPSFRTDERNQQHHVLNMGELNCTGGKREPETNVETERESVYGSDAKVSVFRYVMDKEAFKTPIG